MDELPILEVRRIEANIIKPIYEEMEGWLAPTTEARRFDDLPPQAQAYVKRVSELSRAPVSLISVGPERESTIDID